MKILVRHIIIALVLLFSMSYYSYGQNQNPCQPGYVQCRGRTECIPARQCGVGPPPPGLVVPIDTNLGFLLAAGLGLGIYFLVSAGKKKHI